MIRCAKNRRLFGNERCRVFSTQSGCSRPNKTPCPEVLLTITRRIQPGLLVRCCLVVLFDTKVVLLDIEGIIQRCKTSDDSIDIPVAQTMQGVRV